MTVCSARCWSIATASQKSSYRIRLTKTNCMGIHIMDWSLVDAFIAASVRTPFYFPIRKCIFNNCGVYNWGTLDLANAKGIMVYNLKFEVFISYLIRTLSIQFTFITEKHTRCFGCGYIPKLQEHTKDCLHLGNRLTYTRCSFIGVTMI
jgi:hypothetical protein